jgi:hypothetical protein
MPMGANLSYTYYDVKQKMFFLSGYNSSFNPGFINNPDCFTFICG